jgi:dihydropteroate synthase
MELGRRTCLMGILNVTPDSFADGGRLASVEAAVAYAVRLAEEGADIIDVGGESTRPGATPVPEEEECRRVLPVVEAIRARLELPVSVDTVKAGVARRALELGADMVNDPSAGRDPDMLDLAARTGAPIVLMHMRGTPRTMQHDTRYDDLLGELVRFLRERVREAIGRGVASDKIVVDPGIGFGKSLEGNLLILRKLSALHRVDQPVLIGASRKSFIGAVLDLPVPDRLEGSLAVAALAAWNGAHILRVHDVAATARVVRMIDAVRGD